MERKEFVSPGIEYRAVHLWMLNDALHPAEIRRQIASLAEAGCGAIITRTYMGLRTEYLSAEYMACMEAALNAALEHGLDVFLQAGYMPNGVPGLNPAAQGSGVAAIPRGAELPPGSTVLAATSDFTFAVRPFAHAVDLLSAEAVEAYIDLAYERAWQPLRRYYGRPIRSVWVDEPSFRPPLIPWSPRLPERFSATWGYDLLSHLPSLFQRIGDYQAVRHHYWRTVVEMLKAAYFAKVAQWCADNGLEFSGHLMGEDTLVDQIALTGACMPLYEYMHLPGIDHLSSSLCWTHGARGGEGGLPFILNPKQCTSVAAQLGRPRALAEMYGVSTQGLTFMDQKQIGEYLAVQGINLRCLHASFYSMRGRRKRLHAPNLHYQQPWWGANAKAADYFARLAYVLSQGQEIAQVLVLHPVESAYMCYDPLLYRPALHARMPMPDIERMNRHVVELGLCLNAAGIGWHFGDESLLARHGRVLDDGSMQVGEMRYVAVILPEVKTLRSTTAALLCRLAEAGGLVLTTAGVPALIDGWPNPGVTTALAACARPVEMNRAALTQALGANVVERTAITIDEREDEVWVHRRRTDVGESLLLVNTSPQKAASVRLAAPAGCVLAEWHLQDGQTRDLGSRAQFTMDPLASRVFTARYPAGESVPTPAVAAFELDEASSRCETLLPVQWSVRRQDPNWLPLDTCRWRCAGEEWSPPMPVLAVHDILTARKFEGRVTLEFSFDLEVVPPSLLFVCEDAGGKEVMVNGTPCAYAGLPYLIDPSFLPIDITALVRPGRNTVCITTHFTPLKRSSFTLSSLFENLIGTELENAYLAGDFAVKAEVSPRPAPAGCVRLAPAFTLTAETGVARSDLVSAGYPFFAGTILLRQEVHLRRPKPGERVMLFARQPAACTIAVRCNGHDQGNRIMAPFSWDTTAQVLEGRNLLEVTLTNTLRNLLGPHHRPEGEPDNCWGEGAFKGYGLGAGGNRGDAIMSWAEEGAPDTPTWTNDYMVVPFGLASLSLAYCTEAEKP